jgi:hypothetical protein
MLSPPTKSVSAGIPVFPMITSGGSAQTSSLPKHSGIGLMLLGGCKICKRSCSLGNTAAAFMVGVGGSGVVGGVDVVVVLGNIFLGNIFLGNTLGNNFLVNTIFLGNTFFLGSIFFLGNGIDDTTLPLHNPQLFLHFFSTYFIEHRFFSTYCVHVYVPEAPNVSSHNAIFVSSLLVTTFAFVDEETVPLLVTLVTLGEGSTAGNSGLNWLHSDHPNVFFNRILASEGCES